MLKSRQNRGHLLAAACAFALTSTLSASAMPAATPGALGGSDELSSKSRAATAMVTAIWDVAVVAIITVGAEAAATTMVGGIIAIGGDFNLRPF
jgi:hypothetical protein